MVDSQERGGESSVQDTADVCAEQEGPWFEIRLVGKQEKSFLLPLPTLKIAGLELLFIVTQWEDGELLCGAM